MQATLLWNSVDSESNLVICQANFWNDFDMYFSCLLYTSGMNPKTLQYIMGHADISVTLNTYTHVNFDDAKEEVYRIANS